MLQKFQKIKQQHSSVSMARIHHTLMKEYGWIPLNEFKELPVHVVTALLDEIKHDREEENKRIKRSRRRR